MDCNLVGKFELEGLLLIFISFNTNSKSLAKMGSLNAGTSEFIPKKSPSEI